MCVLTVDLQSDSFIRIININVITLNVWMKVREPFNESETKAGKFVMRNVKHS